MNPVALRPRRSYGDHMDGDPIDGEAATGWKNEEQVDQYLARIDRLAPRAAGESVLVSLLPDRPRRVLDLGCGDGRLTSLVLDARPGVEHAVCTDRSPAMLSRARERFAGDPRVEVVDSDLTDPITELGEFDLIVSGFAIHHLDHARKRALFAEIATQLTPGGLFANLEIVASSTPERHRQFLAAIGRESDDPEDQLAPIDDQLDWMTEAGLVDAECIWRWRGFALLVGDADDPGGGPPGSPMG